MLELDSARIELVTRNEMSENVKPAWTRGFYFERKKQQKHKNEKSKYSKLFYLFF